MFEATRSPMVEGYLRGNVAVLLNEERIREEVAREKALRLRMDDDGGVPVPIDEDRIREEIELFYQQEQAQRRKFTERLEAAPTSA